MILLGQRLAEWWISRQEAKGKQFPIIDPALRYRFLIRASTALWAVALAYVLLGGMERKALGRDAIGQWFLVFIATFGWVPIVVFIIRRHRHSTLHSDAIKKPSKDPNEKAR
ncbi:MAG: hypothetical protein C0426_09810 [Rhodobacter sp.]|nr:hypothetical protein [Rhodobacter sp.]